MTPAVLLLALVTAERLAELGLARRHTADLLARGGFEVGAEHYPFVVLVHATWLGGLWWLGWDHPLDLVWLAIFLGLQGLRVWTLTTLGRRWTTRIIVVPGERLVTGGPYRFMAHPNYLVVVGEIAVLPLCLGLPWFAVAFSVANGIVLAIRTRVETAALIGARHVGAS